MLAAKWREINTVFPVFLSSCAQRASVKASRLDMKIGQMHTACSAERFTVA